MTNYNSGKIKERFETTSASPSFVAPSYSMGADGFSENGSALLSRPCRWGVAAFMNFQVSPLPPPKVKYPSLVSIFLTNDTIATEENSPAVFSYSPTI
jgi:hypothetical protein